jgi:hypothetical protein
LNTKNIALLTLFLSCCHATVFANEIQNIGRFHSVKEVIGQVTKIKEKKISIVDNFKHMFEDAKISGQLRIMYAGYTQKATNVADTYATAVGGILKYELAGLNGFNAAVSVYTSHDISFASGEGIHHNNELSSSEGEYTTFGEAYVNYKHNDLNIRLGRQQLDTPLADSDDIRMIQNSFEAYTLAYINEDFHFLAGHISKWQGIDADLDKGWSDSGVNGSNFMGVAYSQMYELNVWYYNITDITNAFYTDIGINYFVNDVFLIHVMAQFLSEDELANSGYDADIYGTMLEFAFDGIELKFAYNTTDTSQKRQTFSGTGGGTLYTSLDTMTLDNIAIDRKAQAIVSAISYNYDNLNLFYAYGSFLGEKNSDGIKAYIVEHNIGLEYNVNKKFIVSAIYVVEEDRQNRVKTENDWTRAQLMIHYNF